MNRKLIMSGMAFLSFNNIWGSDSCCNYGDERRGRLQTFEQQFNQDIQNRVISFFKYTEEEQENILKDMKDSIKGKIDFDSVFPKLPDLIKKEHIVTLCSYLPDIPHFLEDVLSNITELKSFSFKVPPQSTSPIREKVKILNNVIDLVKKDTKKSIFLALASSFIYDPDMALVVLDSFPLDSVCKILREILGQDQNKIKADNKLLNSPEVLLLYQEAREVFDEYCTFLAPIDELVYECDREFAAMVPNLDPISHEMVFTITKEE